MLSVNILFIMQFIDRFEWRYTKILLNQRSAGYTPALFYFCSLSETHQNIVLIYLIRCLHLATSADNFQSVLPHRIYEHLEKCTAIALNVHDLAKFQHSHIHIRTCVYICVLCVHECVHLKGLSLRPFVGSVEGLSPVRTKLLMSNNCTRVGR